MLSLALSQPTRDTFKTCHVVLKGTVRVVISWWSFDIFNADCQVQSLKSSTLQALSVIDLHQSASLLRIPARINVLRGSNHSA